MLQAPLQIRHYDFTRWVERKDRQRFCSCSVRLQPDGRRIERPAKAGRYMSSLYFCGTARGRGSPSDFMMAACSLTSSASGRLKSTSLVSASQSGFACRAYWIDWKVYALKSG